MHAIILHRDAKIEICVDTVSENRRKKSHFTILQAKRAKFLDKKCEKKTKNVISSLRSPLSEMRLFWWFAHTVDLIVGNKRWRNVLKSAYFQPLSVAFNHADPYGINRRPRSTHLNRKVDDPLGQIQVWQSRQSSYSNPPRTLKAESSLAKWHYCQDVFAAAFWQLLFSLASPLW